MDTVESLQSQMQQIQGQMSGYGADLPGEIQTQLQNAYSPMLKESLGVTKDLMGDYLGRYFDVTQMGPGMAGTTAMDLSPTQKLGVMGRELGTMAGDLQATQRYSDYLGGQMSDAYNRAMQAAQMGQQSLADQYSRLAQQHQMAWQQAEAEKDRALQRELASKSGGGGGGGMDSIMDSILDLLTRLGGGEDEPAPLTAQQKAVLNIQQMAQSFASLRTAGSSGSYKLPNGQMGTSNDAHRYLLNMARTNYGINLNPEWLWEQMGNTPARPQTQMAVL